MEGAPQPLSKADQLDKLRADRDAYIRRVTGREQLVGSEMEILEAEGVDAQLKDFGDRIRALEAEIAQG